MRPTLLFENRFALKVISMPPAYLKYAIDERPRTPRVLHVSDHAVARWIERVMSIDLSVSRRESRRAIAQAKNEGRWDGKGNTNTDSYLLGWLQRNGVDVEAHRRRILDICQNSSLWGTEHVFVGGHHFVIVNGTVITVLS